MTYSALTATLSIMREGNDDILSTAKYDDTALLLVNKTSAKLEMQMDIESALSIETTDTTTLDEVTDNFSTRLSRALSYKQLFLFYQKNDDGEGNKNHNRMLRYAKSYENEKLGFSSLQATSLGASVNTHFIVR